MSIQSEITRISNNVQNTIDVIEQTGVSVPAGANSDILPSLAQSLANEKQDKLTGTQGQIVGFDSSGNAQAQDAPTPASIGAVSTAVVGEPNGIAELDANGLVPASQLPGFVDDVIDAYIIGTTPYAQDWLSLSSGGSPLTPTNSAIYIIVSPGDYQNQQFRWSGTQYAEISSSLALGETMDTAYRGDRGKIAYDHSQTTGNPHGTTAAEVGAVPATTTVNGHALSGNISLTADDVGARPNTWTPSAADVGAVPTSRTVNGKALSADISLTADDVGARPDTWLPAVYRTVTLSSSAWSDNAQSVAVSGVLADESAQLIQPMPAVASQNAYISAGVICSGQAANQLSFACSTTPTEDISLYVVITEVSA